MGRYSFKYLFHSDGDSVAIFEVGTLNENNITSLMNGSISIDSGDLHFDYLANATASNVSLCMSSIIGFKVLFVNPFNILSTCSEDYKDKDGARKQMQLTLHYSEWEEYGVMKRGYRYD